MNHCIPNRKLWPNTYTVFNGFVVTSPLAGKITHYVFRDKGSPLYMMPHELFVCHNSYNLKNTEIIRQEKLLEFGDNIYFTADERNHVILDYEKSLKVHETDCNFNKNLVRTICVMPPKDLGYKCWTELFGDIELNIEKWQQLHNQAMYDVPIFAWISIEINSFDLILIPSFYEFIEVAVDERKIVWETPWNENNVRRPISNYKWDTDEEEEEIIEKKEDQILDVKLKLEGVLIGPREIFCPEMKDHCIYIGLWEKHISKWENLPFGCKFRFDAYFNDVHHVYIAYFYENLTEADDDEEICWVYMDEFNPGNKLIQIRLLLDDCFGKLYNSPDFGLIPDPKRILGPLSYLYSELEEDEIWVNVEDTGHGKKLYRFVISDIGSQPDETVDLIQKAKQLAEQEGRILHGEGFNVDSHGTFYAPKYQTQFFKFPQHEIRNFPPGYWVRFEAKYDVESNNHQIIGGELICDKEPVHNSRLERNRNNVKSIEYQFKIDAEIITNLNNTFIVGNLYNPMYGFILDPECKFIKKKRLKKFKLIVNVDSSNDGLTIFKLDHMAASNEKMDTEKIKNGDIPYNEDEDSLGLEEDACVDTEDEKDPISQVDFLSEGAIRERKHNAQLRKKERDREVKRLLEQQQECEDQANEGGNEIENVPLALNEKQTSASTATDPCSSSKL